jgi:hypothetical protein
MFDEELVSVTASAVRQRSTWDDEIDHLSSEMSMRCEGENDPNTAIYRARIEKLEKMRNLQNSGTPAAPRSSYLRRIDASQDTVGKHVDHSLDLSPEL